MPLYQETIAGLHQKLRRREVGAEELTRCVLDRIEDRDGRLNAYITITPDEAMEQARAADKKFSAGEPAGPLCGIPLAIKDLLATRGVRTTCGSRMLERFVPPYDSTVVQKLKNEGAVLVGKTNMDEFAMGASNETSYFGPCRNPYDPEKVTGGSSGGSACAVAADLCIASVGTDTGGSIRQPAAYCGVVGMKPTYGRVSRFGLVAFASSLDQAGPITKDVTDCSLLLQAICGHDPRDSTSVDKPVPDFSIFLKDDIRGMRFGIPDEYFIEGMDPEVEAALRKAAATFEAAGAVPVQVSLPHTPYVIPVYYLIATAEASSNLARYDGVKYGYRAQGPFQNLRAMYERTRAEGFGPEVKRRIMLGTYALSSGYYDAYYRKAQQVRTLIRRDFEEALRRCDVLLAPASPTAAFPIGEKINDPLQMYLLDIFTASVNLAGLPGISLPCGTNREGLPLGMQILGRPFDEGTVLQAAFAYECRAEGGPGRPPG
jgi:aspartyl-tRNA(Asn)/glutamyl-tRNA(Gln) amidotransferase subunit A